MTAFEVRRADLVASLAAKANGPPFLLTGPPGAGKSYLLRALETRLRDAGALPLFLDLFAAASSPDRFVTAALAALPAGPLAESLAAATRLRVLAESGRQRGAEAVAALLELLASLHDASGREVVLLLDEATEIRSLAYFHGLRDVHQAFGAAIRSREAGAVLATSFPTLARKLWPSFPNLAAPPLATEDIAGTPPGLPVATAEELRRLTAGWPRYVRILWPRLCAGESPRESWTAEMAPGGLLEQACRQTFEVLLLRSRGYGMSKAVLGAVAREEGLKLTALVGRLGRTPGATRDYLQWLVDVDALRREGRRYFYVDPVLRAWVRVHAQGPAPSPAAVRSAAAALLEEAPAPPATAAAVVPVLSSTDEPSTEERPEPDRPPSRRDPLMEID
jgi:hypothetical protein